MLFHIGQCLEFFDRDAAPDLGGGGGGAGAPPSQRQAPAPAPGPQDGGNVRQFPGGQRQAPPPGPAAAGGEDVTRALAEARQQLGMSKREIDALKGQVGEYGQTFDRLKKVFVPDAPDRRQNAKSHYNQMLDTFLEWGVDRERQGNGAPMTVQLGSELYQHLLEYQERDARTQAEINELKVKLNEATDPRTQINQMAFSSLDNFTQTALDQIYGAGTELSPQKAYQFRAISAQLADEIKGLMKNNPQAWDAISRDRAKQQRMVNYFVEQNMPPAARRMVETERIQNTPQSIENLFTALREAREQYAEDPGTLRQIVPRIRAEIIAEMAEQRRSGGRGRGTSMSQMYR